METLVVVHSSLLGTSRPRGALAGRTSDVEWATKEPWPRVARGRASMAMPRVAQGRASGPLGCVAEEDLADLAHPSRPYQKIHHVFQHLGRRAAILPERPVG